MLNMYAMSSNEASFDSKQQSEADILEWNLGYGPMMLQNLLSRYTGT